MNTVRAGEAPTMTHTDCKDKGTVSGLKVSKNAVFNLLSNERRRNVLYVLYDEDELGKPELVDRVTEREYGAFEKKERQRVIVSLTQCHLPRLQDHGIYSPIGSLT